MDLSKNVNYDYQRFAKKIITITVDLTRDEICETLKHDKIKINDDYYCVPQYKLIDCLVNRQYKNITLELEQYF